MRHQKAGRKLGRTSSHRKAMFRNMLASFFEWEKIETTTIKAKELRPLAEKVITLGKRGDLHARRLVLRLIPNLKIVHKLFSEIAPKFENRPGGYTRIIRTGYRAGDKAPMSIIELVQEEPKAKKKKGKKRKKTLPGTAAETRKETKEAKPVSETKEKIVKTKSSKEDKATKESAVAASDKTEKEVEAVSKEKTSSVLEQKEKAEEK